MEQFAWTVLKVLFTVFLVVIKINGLHVCMNEELTDVFGSFPWSLWTRALHLKKT